MNLTATEAKQEIVSVLTGAMNANRNRQNKRISHDEKLSLILAMAKLEAALRYIKYS
jgi:hypothetical protein